MNGNKINPVGYKTKSNIIFIIIGVFIMIMGIIAILITSKFIKEVDLIDVIVYLGIVGIGLWCVSHYWQLNSLPNSLISYNDEGLLINTMKDKDLFIAYQDIVDISSKRAHARGMFSYTFGHITITTKNNQYKVFAVASVEETFKIIYREYVNFKKKTEEE